MNDLLKFSINIVVFKIIKFMPLEITNCSPSPFEPP